MPPDKGEKSAIRADFMSYRPSITPARLNKTSGANRNGQNRITIRSRRGPVTRTSVARRVIRQQIYIRLCVPVLRLQVDGCHVQQPWSVVQPFQKCFDLRTTALHRQLKADIWQHLPATCCSRLVCRRCIRGRSRFVRRIRRTCGRYADDPYTRLCGYFCKGCEEA